MSSGSAGFAVHLRGHSDNKRQVGGGGQADIWPHGQTPAVHREPMRHLVIHMDEHEQKCLTLPLQPQLAPKQNDTDSGQALRSMDTFVVKEEGVIVSFCLTVSMFFFHIMIDYVASLFPLRPADSC